MTTDQFFIYIVVAIVFYLIGAFVESINDKRLIQNLTHDLQEQFMKTVTAKKEAKQLREDLAAKEFKARTEEINKG